MSARRSLSTLLSATLVVLATSAYTHHLLPGITRRFIPLYDYILVSDPLTPDQRDAIGWRRRQGVTDGRTFFNYYRLTDDDRILANYLRPIKKPLFIVVNKADNPNRDLYAAGCFA